MMQMIILWMWSVVSKFITSAIKISIEIAATALQCMTQAASFKHTVCHSDSKICQ